MNPTAELRILRDSLSLAQGPAGQRRHRFRHKIPTHREGIIMKDRIAWPFTRRPPRRSLPTESRMPFSCWYVLFFDHLACRAFISNIGLDSPLRTGPNPHCLHRSICIPGPTLRNPHHSTPLLRPRLPQHIIQLPTLPTLNPRPAFPRTSRTITSIIIIFSLPLPSSSSSQSFLPSPQLLPSIPHRRRGGRRRRHQHRHHLRG